MAIFCGAVVRNKTKKCTVELSATNVDFQSLKTGTTDRKGISASAMSVAVAFACLFMLYISVAALTTMGPKWYVFDFVERFRIFGVDEAYRFYFSRSAWTNPDLYSWNYILPVGLLFDGIVSTVSGADLFIIRCIHVAANVGGLWLLYCAGLRVGVGRFAMLMSVLIVALMPLYMLVSMSVLGESWLIFCVCLMIYLFTHEKWTACALVVSLMPLIRAEGIFFVLAMLVFFGVRKDIKRACLLIAPGFIYLLYLLVSLDSVLIYINWRLALRGFLNVITDPLVFRMGVIGTFNPMWLLPALAAFLTKRMRPLWPLWLGAAVTLLWFVALLMLKLVNYEPRYLLFIMPVCAISWGLLVQSILDARILQDIKLGLVVFLAGISLIVVFDNFLQLDALRTIYGGGARWPVKGISPRPISYGMYGEDYINQRMKIVDEVYGALEKNKSIHMLMVYDPEIFLTLDPARLSPSVKVVLLQIDSASASQFFGGRMLGLFPGGSQFSYFFIDQASDILAANAIYVGKLNCVVCEPLRRERNLTLYAVKFHESAGQHDL